MIVDAYASQPHYHDHVAAVFDALPDSLRGTMYGKYGARPPRGPDTGGLVLVGGAVDAHRVQRRRVILVEHGAGQSYPGDPRSAKHPSYAGGDGWDHAAGFLAPGEACAARWQARYPATPVYTVGSPRLDRWVQHRDSPMPTTQPVVAFSFHWDCNLIPETRSALPHYYRHLGRIVDELRATGFGVIGHFHPRWRATLRRYWADLGVPSVTIDDVAASASVLVADNTSLLYEFAALGRPVVVLNAPWYRRDVQHGLRFWSHVPGLEVDEPDHLAGIIEVAYQTRLETAPRRQSCVEACYGQVDGHAAERAAVAVSQIVDGYAGRA